MGSNRSIEKFVAQCTSRDIILVKEVDLKVDDEGDDEVLGVSRAIWNFFNVCVGLISM